MVVVTKDDKSGAFKDPQVVESLPDLMRSVLSGCRQYPDSMVAQFPGDYTVWQIAEWNPITGQLDVCFNKEFLFNIADLLNQQRPAAPAEGVQDGKQG
jgi:hypothetical protein